MAEHVPFKESNKLLGSGNLPDVEDMAIAVSLVPRQVEEGNPYVHLVSCWKLSPEELEEVNRTGVVWVSTLGVQPPPISIMGHNPFKHYGFKALDIDQLGEV